jgi:hypothetical protein
MFYIESHWIRQNTWKPIVCCLFSGSGINAFRMVSSNSSPAEKSCACAYIAFLAGIFSCYADSRHMKLLSCLCLSLPYNSWINWYIITKFNMGHVFEGGIDVTSFNPVTSTSPSWQTFKLLTLIQKFHQSAYDYETLHADRPQDKEFLIRIFLSKTRCTNMADVWKLKFIFCYMETTHEPLHLHKWSLEQ